MLKQKILDQLVGFTDEEINNLNGKEGVDKSIFVNTSSNTVDANKLLFNDQLLTVRKHPRFIKYPKHKHNYIELIYVYKGEMTHRIDEKEIYVKEGDILLLNQNIEHSIDFCKEEDLIFNFIIKPEFLEYLCMIIEDENELLNFIFGAIYSYENIGEYLVFRLKETQTVKNYIETIITNLYEPQMNTSGELKLLLGLLLCELMKHPEDIECYQSVEYEKLLVSQVLKYILVQYKKGTLEDISRQLHVSNYKISKLIKKQTGKTFIELIQDERLNASAKLLKNSKMSVINIMREVGYDNSTYYYKLFKKKFHQTPHEYRKQFSNAK